MSYFRQTVDETTGVGDALIDIHILDNIVNYYYITFGHSIDSLLSMSSGVKMKLFTPKYSLPYTAKAILNGG